MYFLVIKRGVFIDRIYHVGEDRDTAIQVAIDLCEGEIGHSHDGIRHSQKNEANQDYGFWVLGHNGSEEWKVGYTVKGSGFIDSCSRQPRG